MDTHKTDFELIIVAIVFLCVVAYAVIVTHLQYRRAHMLLGSLIQHHPNLYDDLPKGFKWLSPLVVIRYLRWHNILTDGNFRNSYREIEGLSWHLLGIYAVFIVATLLTIYGVQILGWRW